MHWLAAISAEVLAPELTKYVLLQVAVADYWLFSA